MKSSKDQKKQRILKYLKSEEIPSSKLAIILSTNYYKMVELLNELYKEKEVTFRCNAKGTKYWRAVK